MANDASLRKKLILKEAARLFREKGYLASNQRELAKRAGIKGGSLYHHFSSKQDILFQLMENTVNDMTARLGAILSQMEDTEEKLRRALRFHIEYTIYGPDETYITGDELRNLEPDNYKRIIAKRDDYQRFFEMIFREGRQQLGWMVTDDKLMARMVILMGTSVYRWYKPEGPLSPEEIAEQYVELVCRGLVPRHP